MDPASIGVLPIAIILVTIAVGAFVKGITGLGLPIFAIPALALFVPVDTAVVVMALPTLVANVWLVTVNRDKLPLMREHRAFLLLGIIGTFAGTWLLANLDDTVLRTLLAAWLGVYLWQHFTGRTKSAVFSGGSGFAGPLGFAAGSLQGATGISAPIIAPYFHARDFALSTYAFAVAFAFALFALAQLSALTAVQLVTPALLGYSLLATLTTVLVMPFGIRLSHRLSREAFGRFLLLVFVLIELKLIYDIFVLR